MAVLFIFFKIKNQKPTIFLKITNKLIKKNRRTKIKKIRSLDVLNKFLKGVKITNIKPARLLIKNLGYLKILVQKLFI